MKTTVQREYLYYQVMNTFDKWQDPDHIRLHAGELTMQEMRTVLAVLRAIRWEINELHKENPSVIGKTIEKTSTKTD